MPEELRIMCQGKAAEAIEVACRLLHDDTQPGATRLKAAEVILDRGYGKPSQSVDVGYRDLSNDDLIRRATAIADRVRGVAVGNDTPGADTAN